LQNKFGFNWLRTRDIIKAFSGDSAIKSLQSTGINLSSGSGADAFCAELFRRLDVTRPNVIDAIRPRTHLRRIQDEYANRAHLVSVVAPRSLRQTRFENDNRTDSIQERDEHPVEADVPILVEESAFMIVNQNHLDFRVEQLVQFIKHINNDSSTTAG